jgi:hypothetical protein
VEEHRANVSLQPGCISAGGGGAGTVLPVGAEAANLNMPPGAETDVVVILVATLAVRPLSSGVAAGLNEEEDKRRKELKLDTDGCGKQR